MFLSKKSRIINLVPRLSLLCLHLSFLPMTKADKGERAWEQGCRITTWGLKCEWEHLFLNFGNWIDKKMASASYRKTKNENRAERQNKQTILHHMAFDRKMKKKLNSRYIQPQKPATGPKLLAVPLQISWLPSPKDFSLILSISSIFLCEWCHYSSLAY